MVTFEEFKKRKEAQYKASNIPYTEEDLRRQYDATKEYSAGVSTATEQDKTKREARKQAAETLRLNVDNPNLSLSERLNLGKSVEPSKPEEITPRVSPVAESTTAPRKPFYPTPTGKPVAKAPTSSEPAASAPAAVPTETRVMVKELARELQAPESKAILDQMTSLAKSPEYQRSTPPETQGQLSSAIQAAKELYNKEATKNEWLEVAQTLAGAVAQYGGAQAAGNRYTSQVNPNAGNIDYGSRISRAQKDYLETVRQAEGESGRTRQQWEDTESQKRGAYGQAYEPLKERLRNAQLMESESARYTREESLQSKKDAQAQQKEDSDLWKLQVKKTDDEIESLRDKDNKLRTAVSELTRDDIDSKEKEKIALKLAPEVSTTGLSINEISRAVEEVEAGQPGIWDRTVGGKKKATSSEKFKTIYEALKDRAGINKLKELEEKRALLGQTKAPILGSGQSVQESAIVRIQAPDGTVKNIRREQAQKYIQKGGKLVE